MGQIQGPSPDQVIDVAPVVLAVLSDLLADGVCDIPSADLDVFCVATLNLLAQVAEEYAELAGITTEDLVRQLAGKLFSDSRQVRKPGTRQSPPTPLA